jgi:protein TonB
MGIKGRVLVRALVSETGQVMRAEVVRSPDDSLSESARNAVLRFRYRPALKKGVPVKTWITEAIEFR